MPDLLGMGSRATDLTSFGVNVDGEPLPGTVSLVSADISAELNRIAKLSLTLFDGDAAKQEFEVSSGDLLVPGKTIELLAGYGTDKAMIFRGIITAQRVRVRKKGDSVLCVEARDAAFRLTLDRKSGYFTELTEQRPLRGNRGPLLRCVSAG